jgi:hypothetical protein
MLAGVKASHVPGELSFAHYSPAGPAVTGPTRSSADLSSPPGPSAAAVVSRALDRCVADTDPVLKGVDGAFPGAEGPAGGAHRAAVCKRGFWPGTGAPGALRGEGRPG